MLIFDKATCLLLIFNFILSVGLSVSLCRSEVSLFFEFINIVFILCSINFVICLYNFLAISFAQYKKSMI